MKEKEPISFIPKRFRSKSKADQQEKETRNLSGQDLDTVQQQPGKQIEQVKLQQQHTEDINNVLQENKDFDVKIHIQYPDVNNMFVFVCVSIGLYSNAYVYFYSIYIYNVSVFVLTCIFLTSKEIPQVKTNSEPAQSESESKKSENTEKDVKNIDKKTENELMENRDNPQVLKSSELASGKSDKFDDFPDQKFQGKRSSSFPSSKFNPHQSFPRRAFSVDRNHSSKYIKNFKMLKKTLKLLFATY